MRHAHRFLTSRRIWASAFVWLATLAAASADRLLQWGELTGVTPGGTNIVNTSQGLVGAGTTYTGQTNNPAVGPSYYPASSGRSPFFSAASPAATRLVEQATSGDRITLYASTATGNAFRGLVMWSSNLMLTAGQPFTATSVVVVLNQRLNANTVNQSVRLVVQQGGAFFLTDGLPFGASATTNSFVLATQNWSTFTPFTSGTETIGGGTSAPSLTNVEAIGYYFTAENGGPAAANTGAQVSYFAVDGEPVNIGPVQYLLAASAQPFGTGNVSPTGGLYDAGSTVQVTAVAAPYYGFAAWSGDGAGTNNPITLLMTQARTVQATFNALLVTNGTPQWWLAGYSLPPTDAGALSDTDLDGRPAWQEYQAGTDPTVPNGFGAITCTLSPAGAVSAGAQWRLTSGNTNWQASGSEISGLSTGDYTVTFRAVPLWQAPAEAPVSIAMNQTSVLNAAYVEQTSSQHNARLVDFGAKLGTGYYRNQSAPRTYPALRDQDDNGSLANDSVRAWIFSTNQPLHAPALEYDTAAPSAVFYGGLSVFAVDNAARTLSEGLVNQNHEFMDDLNLMGLGEIISGEQFSAYGVWFWDKNDFLNGGPDYPVRFDTNSTLAVHISRYWGGVHAGRWLVRQGGQFYLSQATFAGRTNQYDLTTTNRMDDPGDGANNPVVRTTHVLHPLTTLWAPYQPGGAPGTNDDYEIAFNADTATFSVVSFTNVTAVGFFVERRLSAPQPVASGLLPSQPMAVKWNAFQCQAVVERPEAPSFYQPMTNVLADATHLAAQAVPYDVWRRVFRHMVRRQYPRDLGPLTYALERNGAIGTMRVDEGPHAGTEPVREITWLDAVAFCNGLSELEGLEPCYYSDPAFTSVLRMVLDRDVIAAWSNRPTVYWKASAGGFRLPTRSEWEATPPALRSTNAWEYIWHPSGFTADPAVHTTRTVCSWGPSAPTQAVGRFSERPWQGSPRIGFRVARNASALPDPAPSGAGGSRWTFDANDVLAPATPLDLSALRTEIAGLNVTTNLPAGLALPEHAADTNFVPSDLLTNTPYSLAIGRTEVPFKLWNLVQGWAREQGYVFNYDGDMGSMGHTPAVTTHTNLEPVTQISLYDAYVWCNALSELMGRRPVYYLDSGFTQVYRQATLFRLETLKRDGSPNWPGGALTPWDTASLIPVFMDVEAGGYRLLLPQEWRLVDVTNALTADPAYNWLVGNANGQSQPVGTLLPNALGLFDMEGNVLELTWGSTKSSINNAPFRMGGHFARASLIGKNPAHSAEFAGVGRTHVGFRIASLPATNTPEAILSLVIQEPGWGAVQPTGGTYAVGSTVTLTATPDDYFHFVAWTGAVSSTASVVDVSLPSNLVVTAVFAENRTATGTPHWWLAGHGLGTNDSDALHDSDGDGLPAWSEFHAGTDPTNRQSALTITNQQALSLGRVVTWPTASGRVYSVNWSSNLMPIAFSMLASNLTGGVYTDTLHHADRAGFYQIEVQSGFYP